MRVDPPPIPPAKRWRICSLVANPDPLWLSTSRAGGGVRSHGCFATPWDKTSHEYHLAIFMPLAIVQHGSYYISSTDARRLAARQGSAGLILYIVCTDYDILDGGGVTRSSL